jgi:threonine dehydrogenase-like Zn-dependent dehydrogenase
MRAAVLVGPRQLELVDDWPEPDLPADGVIVQMTGLGICGSDLAIWAGRRSPVTMPWVLGHEAIGTVIAAGEAVSDRAVGDRVVIEPNYPCGSCSSCREGRTSTCPNRRIVGINSPGFLVERAAVPAAFAWPAPDGVTDEDLVCAEPVAVAQTAIHTAGLSSGARCAVIGAGAQGLFVCQLAVAAGCEVAVIEPQPGRLELAESLGARPAVGTEHYPFVFETSGTSAGVRKALDLVQAGGTVILIGIPHQDVPIPIGGLVRRQVHVIGSLIYDHPGGFERTLKLLAARETTPSRILGTPFPFAAASEALSAAATFAGKSWIAFTDGVRGWS